jgi:ferredoxin-thioredoxin reductase catalytic chain
MNDTRDPERTDAGDISPERTEALYKKLRSEAEAAGYHLNPDAAFTRDLVRSLLVNEERYGYWACPCRLADGDPDADRDIVCPCDYRDADLDEHDMCYCALYVSERVLTGEVQTGPIPERRPVADESGPATSAPHEAPRARPDTGALSQPVWRCRVCGYLCAREKPPLVCPVCKAKRDRFERFM